MNKVQPYVSRLYENSKNNMAYFLTEAKKERPALEVEIVASKSEIYFVIKDIELAYIGEVVYEKNNKVDYYYKDGKRKAVLDSFYFKRKLFLVSKILGTK